MPRTRKPREVVEPLIRWAGSKRGMLRELESEAPRQFGTYYEPFFGSGCLFYRLRPARAVLSDMNSNLIGFYEQARQAPQRVFNSATRFRRGAEAYYKLRDRFNRAKDKASRASMFYYLNRFCFNAIYRTNERGEFNVPFGTRTGAFPSLKQFSAASQRLQGATLICADFEQSLEAAVCGDFVYLDPPYAYKQHRDRGEYGKGSFKVADLERLDRILSALHAKGVLFLLSYLDCADIQRIATRFGARRIPVQRHVAGVSAARRGVSELLIRNF